MGTVRDGIRISLAELLKESGKKNKDLADYLGVGKSTVTNWLSGNSSIDIERIPQICDYFNISVNELFGMAKRYQSPDEQELLSLYRRMSDDMKKTLLETARNFAALSGGGKKANRAVFEQLVESAIY